MKIDKSVQKETLYISLSVIIMSALMESVFLILRFWDLTVLWGNILGATASILNFFLMGITVQKAVLKDEKDAANFMKLSQTLRMFGVTIFVIVGVVLHCFNTIAVIIPLFFPRIAIAIQPLFQKKNNKE